MKKDLISRRKFLRAAGLTAAGAALAACAAPPAAAPAAAPAAGGADAAAAPTTAPAAAAGSLVSYWFGWGNLAPAMETLQKSEVFKTALGSNTFEFKPSVNAEGFLTAVAGGTPPDGASNLDYVQYMAKGSLREVGDQLATSSVLKKDDFLPDIWENGAWQGKQYGVPGLEGFLNYGLNFNSKMAEDVGLDPAKPPETWEDLFEWHKKLTTFDDAGNLKQMGLDPYDAMAGEPDFASLSYGWLWYDEAAGKHDINNAKMVEHLKMTSEFIKVIGPDKLAGLRQVEGQGGWGNSFNAGVQAMIIEGYWHPGETKIQKPEVAPLNRAGWAPVPGSRVGTKIQMAQGHYIISFKDSKNPDGMFKVSEVISGSDEAANIIWKEVGWLPPRTNFIDKVNADEYPGLKFYFDSLTSAKEWLRKPRRSPIHWYVTTQLTEVRDKLARGQMTAEEAAEEVQKRADNEWKNQGYGKAGG